MSLRLGQKHSQRRQPLHLGFCNFAVKIVTNERSENLEIDTINRNKDSFGRPNKLNDFKSI